MKTFQTTIVVLSLLLLLSFAGIFIGVSKQGEIKEEIILSNIVVYDKK